MSTLTAQDIVFLNRAIEIASIPVGLVSPNPYVGAVIVKNNIIISEGFHAKAGSLHAEVVAIQNAKIDIAGSTIYVSLEPCCHQGKTGPCTKAIINAGITKVIYAINDSNPQVTGKSASILRSHGIEVICANDSVARFLNRHFFINQLTKRPYITLKAAMSLDGKIASKTGDSQWITGKEARKKGHELRALHDAILIGKKTLLNDNPTLTVRLNDEKYKNPLRILLLRNFKGIEHADYNLFETTETPTWVIYPATAKIDGELVQQLKKQHVKLIPLSSDEINIRLLTDFLYDNGIMSVLLEGGSSIYNAFLSEQMVDELAFFYGPRLIGDRDAPSLWDQSGIESLSDAPIVHIYDTEMLGNSTYICATFKEFS